jgi:hypothetical protein
MPSRFASSGRASSSDFIEDANMRGIQHFNGTIGAKNPEPSLIPETIVPAT